MNEYQFSFDKKRLILVIVGLLFAGILTFCCGVITGVGLLMPAQRELAQLQSKLKPPAQNASAKPSVQMPVQVKNPLPASRVPTATPGPVATGPAPSAIPRPVATPAAPADAPPSSGPPAATPATDPVNQPFVLQLGAFREQKNAKQLQADLKVKGYPTTIFDMMDEDQRTWHMVRFGGYKDLSAASHAASDFIGKEGIQALVRRSDSL